MPARRTTGATLFSSSGSMTTKEAPRNRIDPGAVIIMNPIYREEIAEDLRKRGLEPEILAIDDGIKSGDVMS